MIRDDVHYVPFLDGTDYSCKSFETSTDTFTRELSRHIKNMDKAICRG